LFEISAIKISLKKKDKKQTLKMIPQFLI